MKILILDDVVERVLELKKYLSPKDEVEHHTNVLDFMFAAGKQTYDLIILDHDLPLDKDECRKNGLAYVDNYCSDRHGKTGMDAVKFLCSDVLGAQEEQKIIIWSWSENALLMKKKLQGNDFTNVWLLPYNNKPEYFIELFNTIK